MTESENLDQHSIWISLKGKSVNCNLMFFRSLLLLFCLLFLSANKLFSQAAIMYQYGRPIKGIEVGWGSYGRVGVGWTGNNTGLDGRRLNLNNMGSIGGRFEEQDYLELGVAFRIRPEALLKDSTSIMIAMRGNVFSSDGSLFGRSNTRSNGGLTIGLPELFVEGRNVFTKGLNFWAGARFYRGFDVHMADYFYFNDHSGQGFGVEYKDTRLSFNFIGDTDTTSTVPPYFFLNIKSGTQSLEIRRRVVYTLEHDIRPTRNHLITLLGEYHRIGNPTDIPEDTTDNILLSFPADDGFVLGVKYIVEELNGFKPGSFNQIAVRYGFGIANGGDGGSTRTWETFGAVDTLTYKFDRAYSLHIVEHLLLNFSSTYSLNAYAIYNRSMGAAPTTGLANTYLGREVFNFKQDLSFGVKNYFYLTKVFHLQAELSYSQRQDGEQEWYRMGKLAIVPTISLQGERSVWARPHIRFIYSIAHFNQFAADNQYSPYLELVGPQRWGHYFGVRAEWWVW